MLKRINKGWLAGLAALWLALAALSFPATAGAQVRSGGTLSGMVRVYLSSIGSYQSVDLTIAGSYSIGGNANRALTRGEKITVSNQGGTLRLTRGGASESMGSSFKLRRHATSGENGVRIAQSRNSGNLYPGDIEFRARNGNVQIIVHVYIEDYMRGVLPYEMSNSFPLEALKAQAVAARTYTLKKMSAGASDYDVVDTTSDQTYRGTPSGNANCISAVTQTQGIVGLYDGSYMASYYTASNGGQTESVKNAWNSTSYSYLTVKDDPYDLRNSASSTRSATIYKSGSMHSGLSEMLRAAASPTVSAMGYLSGSENITIRGVQSVDAIDPKYAAPSRLYTKVAFSLLLTATRVDGVRENIAQPVTVTLDYFSQMESLLSLSLNSTKNELITVEETDSAFKIVARRYGHGIGMSQRGAQQMAKEGLTYEEILDFYYPGTERVAYTFTRTLLSALDGNGSVTEQEEIVDAAEAGDAIVSLNNPLDVLNLRKETSTTSAIVARIPHGTPLRVLEKLGSWCHVQYGALSGYVSGDFLAFVEADLPTDGGAQTQPTLTPQPTAIPDAQRRCVVALESGKLNLRARPSTSSSVLALLPNGTALTYLGAVDGDWALVEYSGIQGYAAARYLRMDAVNLPQATPTPTPQPDASTDQPEAEAPTDKAVVVLSSETQTLNLRLLPTTASSILSRIRHGSQVQILERYSAWSCVRYGSLTGYVMNEYLYFPGNFQASGGTGSIPQIEPTPMPTTEPTAVPPVVIVPEATATPLPETAEKLATVQLSNPDSSLNVRRLPNANADRIGEIPHGLQVRVLEYGASWCGIDYAGMTGYVATQYLRFDQGTGGTGGVVAPMPEVTPEPTPKPQRVSAVKIDVRQYLNVREAPDTQSRIIGRVRTGSIQTVTDTVDGFYQIIFDGDSYGYISADYADPVEWSDQPADPPVIAPGENSAGGSQATTESQAPGGAGEATESEPLPVVPEIAPVPEPTPMPEIPAVPDAYETASPSKVINEGKTGYVCELYEKCGDENSALMGIEKGESVRVIAYAPQDGWVQVEIRGVYGYMRLKDLSLRYEVVRLISGVSYSLYEGASYDAAILATLSGGETVSVLDADGEWAKVRMEGAKTGYVLFEALNIGD